MKKLIMLFALVAMAVSAWCGPTPTPTATITTTPIAYYQSTGVKASGAIEPSFSLVGFSANYSYSDDATTLYIKVISATAAALVSLGVNCTLVGAPVYTASETSFFLKIKNSGPDLRAALVPTPAPKGAQAMQQVVK